MTRWEMRFGWIKALEAPVVNISIKDLLRVSIDVCIVLVLLLIASG